MNRKLLIAGGLLAGLVVLVLLASGRGGHAPEVDVAEAVHATLADTTLASGNLVFETQIQLRPEVSGRVAKIFHDVGDIVSPGDTLLELDTAKRTELGTVWLPSTPAELSFTFTGTTWSSRSARPARRPMLLISGMS